MKLEEESSGLSRDLVRCWKIYVTDSRTRMM